MADKYSTIQQHQPLRVPAGWSRQEKALIVQLDETFDDIYRRFGRLRMEDLSKSFRKQIEDDEGNIAQLLVDIGQITIEVGNKYDKVSGIAINTNGIALSGSKYVDIGAGCSVDIESGGDINVKSGGDLNVKSGGKIAVESGGDFEIKSGGDLKIKSGGVLDVNTNNFILDSANQKMVSGSWTFNERGIYKQKTVTAGDTHFTIGDYATTFIAESGTIRTGITAYTQKVNGVGYSTLYFDQISTDDILARMMMYCNGPASSGIAIAGGGVDKNALQGGKWDITAGYISYDTLVQNSSREIKHDIRGMDSQGDMLDRLRPVTFVYDDDPEEKTRAGLIYEETEPVLPEICTGDEGDKAINYVELIPMLLKEIQDLRARVALLEGGQQDG